MADFETIGKFLDEFLAREQFGSLLEVEGLIEPWRRHYDSSHPQSFLSCEMPVQ